MYIFHKTTSFRIIKKTNKFSVSILNEESNPNIIGTFGFSSSKDIDKYQDFDNEIVDGIPVIKDSNGYIVCEVTSVLETETHTIFVGKVINMNKYDNKNVMTYKYYHEVLKGSSPKKAPTYQENIVEEIKGNRWKCMLCGYIYEGDELPLDFTCPICGQGYEAFEKID